MGETKIEGESEEKAQPKGEKRMLKTRPGRTFQRHLEQRYPLPIVRLKALMFHLFLKVLEDQHLANVMSGVKDFFWTQSKNYADGREY